MIIYVLGIIEQSGKFLFLLRKGAFFDGYYGFAGGKVDNNESVASALIREVREEIGIIVTPNDMRFVHSLSCKNERNVEFLAFAFNINRWQGEIVNCEPEKHPEIKWFSLDELPHNVIPRHRCIIEMVQRGELYSEEGW